MTPGDIAPDFTAATPGGPLTLSALRGGPVVLYFYPKDDTPACTQEARDFSDLAAEFATAGARVIGVSKDSAAKHGRFAAKHALAVTLVSDEGGDICERYGVWAEKTLYGKTYLGIVRSTFLIDAGGRIAQVWPKVSVKGHAETVLAALRALA